MSYLVEDVVNNTFSLPRNLGICSSFKPCVALFLL